MATMLSRDIEPEGVFYHLEKEGRDQPPDLWPRFVEELPPDQRRAVPELMVLLETGEAEVVKRRVLIPHEIVGWMEEEKARSLLLPEAVPYTLEVRASGGLNSSDAKFQWWWTELSGRRLAVVERIGAFVVVGRRRFRLPKLLFDALKAMESYNRVESKDLGERLRMAGMVAAALGLSNVRADRRLQVFRVSYVTSFTLDVRRGEDGSITFDPVLARRSDAPPLAFRPSEEFAEGGSSGGMQEALPPEPMKDFQEQFRRLPVRPTYLATGWYVVLDEGVQRGLEVVKEKQSAPAAEREAFVLNPFQGLRESLTDAGVEEQPEFEEAYSELFWEREGYGERVRQLVTWTPRVLPWISHSKTPWLPPEKFGLMVGEQRIELLSEAVTEARAEIQKALEQGADSVEIAGIRLPADAGALAAIDRLAEIQANPESQMDVWGGDVPSADGNFERTDDSTPPSAPAGRPRLIVLDIEDNFSEVTYSAYERPHRPGEPALPASLATELKPHQAAGVRWLQSLWIQGRRGGLLADDMGLGKTLQALTFLAWLREEMEDGAYPKRPFLVVAPTGLIANWLHEHDKHFNPPGIGEPLEARGASLRNLRLVEGGRRAELDLGSSVLDLQSMRKADWVLTTYETVRDFQHSFGQVQWAAVLFDEAQRIKTPGTLVTVAAKGMNADFWLLLTGTPVENRLADIWCHFDTFAPGLLGTLQDFSREYEQEIDDAKLNELKKRIDHTEPEPATHPKPLLRRIKADHLEGLPPRWIHNRRVVMPPPQAQRYTEVVESTRRAKADRPAMLKVIHELRVASLHPLAPQAIEDDNMLINYSARLQATFEVLDEIASKGEKALVFLEFIDHQGFLLGAIQRRFALPRPPMLINGSVEGDERKRRVDEFNEREGFDVMILSPRAGGVGLTLTGANHVIHLTRWWNPAVEDQCSDRVYRIGQAREVHVYNIMAQHPEYGEYSFDIKLHELIERKRELSRRLLVPGQATHYELEQLYGETVALGGR